MRIRFCACLSDLFANGYLSWILFGQKKFQNLEIKFLNNTPNSKLVGHECTGDQIEKMLVVSTKIGRWHNKERCNSKKERNLP